MDGLFDIARVLGAVKAGHQYVDAVAQADQKAGEQRDKDTGGPHRAQRRRPSKPPDDRHV